jgi:hypothetical protein
MYVPLSRDSYYTAARVTVVHANALGHEDRIDGTCFFIHKGNRTFIVTNRHNFEASLKDVKWSGYRAKSMKCRVWCKISENEKGKNIQLAEFEMEIDHSKIAFPENQSEDVAVLQVDIDQKIMRFDFEELAAEIDFSKSLPTDFVVVCGYPGLTEFHAPLARMGVFSSDPMLDYTGKNDGASRRVAIEAMSTGGMSGSPVIALQRGLRSDDIIFSGFRRQYVAGINCSHYSANIEKIGTIHSGISSCIKSTVIREIIERIEIKSACSDLASVRVLS